MADGNNKSRFEGTRSSPEISVKIAENKKNPGYMREYVFQTFVICPLSIMALTLDP
ncbi:MAG: hypothetical protein QW791_03665 [Candidatus Bathyarchaeia archaeon]